jgi:hypothetical protein
VSLTKVAIDFNISPSVARALKEIFGHHGYDFIHLSSLVHHRSKDVFWADVYKKFGGIFVISGDSKIAYKPHEAIAFVDNGLVSVFPSENWDRLKLHEKCVILFYYWPTIERTFKSAAPGTNWRLPVSARPDDVILKPVSLAQLEIPPAVLAKARSLRPEGQATG